LFLYVIIDTIIYLEKNAFCCRFIEPRYLPKLCLTKNVKVSLKLKFVKLNIKMSAKIISFNNS